MTDATLLYRQINPSWIQNGRVGSLAFRPMPKDENLLSVYDGDMISAENAWQHFTETLEFKSSGVLGATVADCQCLDLKVRPDPTPFPEHAVIDFTGLTNSAAQKKSQLLRNKSESRGWQYKPSADS